MYKRVTNTLFFVLLSTVIGAQGIVMQKKINLDSCGDLSIATNCNAFVIPDGKLLTFYYTKPRKVVVKQGAALNFSGQKGGTVIFAGKTDLVIEPGGKLLLAGQKICMTGCTRMIFPAVSSGNK